MLTNRLNLPASIVSAVANDPYVGGGDISVTRLIAPPFQRKLRRQHATEEDVTDRIWALVGQIGHSILERYKPERGVAEERLYIDRGGWSISGQFDLIEDRILTDFKFTSVWAQDGKIEWEQQLNLLRLLAHDHFMNTHDARYVVDTLQIIAIYRDWQKSKVGTKRYPTSQIGVIPIRMWPLEETITYLDERIAAHQHPDPEPCSDEERWKASDVVAVMKGGRGKAARLFDTKQEAINWISDRQGYFIHVRAGEYRRCAAYCDVSHVCPVWQQVVADTPF